MKTHNKEICSLWLLAIYVNFNNMGKTPTNVNRCCVFRFTTLQWQLREECSGKRFYFKPIFIQNIWLMLQSVKSSL